MGMDNHAHRRSGFLVLRSFWAEPSPSTTPAPPPPLEQCRPHLYVAPLVTPSAPCQLETDAALVLPRARAALATTDVHMVVANLLSTRYEEAWLVAPPPSGRPPADDDQGGVVRVVRPPAPPGGGGRDGREAPVIEEALVAALAAAHEAFIAGRRGG